MVDAEKMAKSKGNFLMLLESVEEFSSDATRFALADAGDSMEDANFDRAVANQAVTYLYNEEEWFKTVLADEKAGVLRDGDYSFMDRAFNNEMDYLIEATQTEFLRMCYREGIHRCWFDLMIARDMYRDWSTRCSIPMHRGVVLRFMRVLVVMMSPICPHWSENLWCMLGEHGSVCTASWPTFAPCNKLTRKEYVFFREFLKNIRLANLKVKLPPGPRCAHIYLASVYEEKKITMLRYLQTICDESGAFPEDLMQRMKTFVEGDAGLKKDTKLLMQFGAFMRDEAKDRGPDALATELSFDQKAILQVITVILISLTYNRISPHNPHYCVCYFNLLGEFCLHHEGT
jgi:leucyl-tRNA synthetase